MPNTKMTGEKLKLHVSYYKFAYVVVIVAALLVGNLLYTTTSYRAPNAHRIDIELIGAYVNTGTAEAIAAADQLLEAGQAWETARDAEAGIDTSAEDYRPDLEELTVVGLSYSGDGSSENDYYAAQKYMVLLAAQEGDIYFISRDQVVELVDQNILVPLDEYLADGTLSAGSRNLGRVTFDAYDDDGNATGEQAVFALQADSMLGLFETFSYDPTDKYACILRFSQNPDTAAAVLGEMQRLYEREDIAASDVTDNGSFDQTDEPESADDAAEDDSGDAAS